MPAAWDQPRESRGIVVIGALCGLGAIIPILRLAGRASRRGGMLPNHRLRSALFERSLAAAR